MDIVEVLKRKNPEEVRRALVEVHRAKAFSLADAEYVAEELEKAARLHAYHIALMSLIAPEVEVDPDSVTGLDYRLARSFQEGLAKCAELPGVVEDGFYRVVLEELNRIIRSVCSPQHGK